MNQLSMQKTIQVYGWQPSDGINFGDEIGFDIVHRLAERFKSGARVVRSAHRGPNKLLAVGSIIQVAGYKDVIWGSGINGKTWIPSSIGSLQLNVAAVRGPITRQALLQNGVHCPEVYGDPGLLYPILFNNEIMRERQSILSYFERMNLRVPKRIFIPNLNDLKFYAPELDTLNGLHLVRPSLSAAKVAAYISLADEVYSSSLHGVVFADVMGKPVQLVPSRFEALLKYDDYFLGTGRETVQPARLQTDFVCNVAPLNFNYSPLVAAFPIKPGNALKAMLIMEDINRDLLSPTAINHNDPSISIDNIEGLDVLGGGPILTFRVPNNSMTRKMQFGILVKATSRGLGTYNIQSSVNGAKAKCTASLGSDGVHVKVQIPEQSSLSDFLVKLNFSSIPEGNFENKCFLPDQYFLVFDNPQIHEITSDS